MLWNSNLQLNKKGTAFGPAAQRQGLYLDKEEAPQDIWKVSRNQDEWCEHDDTAGLEEDFIFVNLNENRESYTAYNGTPVWNAIYEENCMMDRFTSKNINPSL